MQKVLVIIDMQHDFVDGVLGTSDAQSIVPLVEEQITTFEGPIIFTRDTHNADYLSSQEGELLPIEHCQKDTQGWQIMENLVNAAEQRSSMYDISYVDKPNFGSFELLHRLEGMHAVNPIESITLMGLCTDICVVSNALILKAGLPEIPIHVNPSCCAGVTKESHVAALLTMKMCQCILD